MLLVLLLTTSLAADAPKGIAECLNETSIRSRHFCLEKTGTADALPRILEVGQAALEKDDDLIRRTEYFDAADNAGRLAARTDPSILFTWAADVDPFKRIFGLRALGHMLSILRMGYGRGGDADKTHHAQLVPKVGEVCAAALTHADERVVQSAIRCVGETRDAKHTDAVVTTMLRTSPLTQHMAAAALSDFSGLGAHAEKLRPLTKILETPFEHRDGAVNVRGDICTLLRRTMAEGDTWAQAAALAAVDHIGTKSSQSRDACAALAAKSGAAQAAPSKPANTRNWFPEQPLERCDYRAFESLALCAYSTPSGQKRAFTLVVRDPSQLDKSGQHKVVHTVKVPAQPNEYMMFEAVAAWQLEPGRHLISVPLVTGTPDSFHEGRMLLYLFDAKTKRATQAWTGNCGAGCSHQTIELITKKGSPVVDVDYVQTVSGQRVVTKLQWKNKKLTSGK